MSIRRNLIAMAVGVIPALAAFPSGANETAPYGRWFAEDINGGGVIDRLQTTIELSPDGQVMGFGGCNGFRGQATLDGAKLTFGPLAGTRKACPPAVMDQEQKFHAALEVTAGWRFDAQQAKLLLTNAAGDVVVRLAKL